MNNNIFVAVLDTNGKQTIEALIAIDKKDAKKTIEEQMSLSQILMLSSMDEMAKMEESYTNDSSDYFVMSKNEFDVISIDGKTEDEVSQISEKSSNLVFSRSVFLELMSAIAQDFLDRLNTSPIVSQRIAGDLL